MFYKLWKSTTEYGIWEDTFGRYIDEQHYIPYLDWLSLGNHPPPGSGDRFILIDASGNPYIDPNKDAILAAEAEQAQIESYDTLLLRVQYLEQALLELLQGATKS